MSKKETEAPVELECQFILRLPEDPAKVLRDMLRSGTTSLKDRFTIKLENDVRYGEVKVDNWHLHAKVVDLPTIVESLKTIDNKSFYKTADICQIMICKEEDDQVTTDEESPTKHKKKDPNKVEKKFLWPHGITPPLKNVRKRRFRKTLKKKYVEAPEVEKEVKRLLRGDNDAVSVKWEVITEEEEKKVHIKEEPLDPGESQDTSANNTQNTLAEHDIFGEPLSESDEEDPHLNLVEIEENSRLSADDSRISDSMSLQMSDRGERSDERLVTEFSGSMFPIKAEPEDDRDYMRSTKEGLTNEDIHARLDELRGELNELRIRRSQQEMEVANIENIALRQRFQEILDGLIQEQLDKEQEFQELSQLLM